MQILTDIHKKYPPVACRLDRLSFDNILEKRLSENHCKIVDRTKILGIDDLDLKFDMSIPSISDYISNVINQAAKEWKEKENKWFIETLKAYGVEESEILDRVQVIPQYIEHGTDIYRVNIDGKYAFSFKQWIESDFDYKNPYTYNSTFCIKMI